MPPIIADKTLSEWCPHHCWQDFIWMMPPKLLTRLYLNDAPNIADKTLSEWCPLSLLTRLYLNDPPKIADKTLSKWCPQRCWQDFIWMMPPKIADNFIWMMPPTLAFWGETLHSVVYSKYLYKTCPTHRRAIMGSRSIRCLIPHDDAVKQIHHLYHEKNFSWYCFSFLILYSHVVLYLMCSFQIYKNDVLKKASFTICYEYFIMYIIWTHVLYTI